MMSRLFTKRTMLAMRGSSQNPFSHRLFSMLPASQALFTPSLHAPLLSTPYQARLFSSSGSKHEFQAETRELLNIVTHAIYTDKEVFLRELISNASDALEKLRHYQVTGSHVEDPALPLAIHIDIDEEAGTLTISDSGIGMTQEEIQRNLGTIARSGSKEFVKTMLEDNRSPEDAAQSIIGQFGVGFYSAFMVSDKVTVYSKSYAGGEGVVWNSDGLGTYEVEPLTEENAPKERLTRGSRIVMYLKDTATDFKNVDKVKGIITQYSNFLPFPIHVNGENVNTITALWREDPSNVTEEQYRDFYRFVVNSSYDSPQFTVHFRTDAPIDMKSLVFIPPFHTEKFAAARMEPGVSIYCRNVLIEQKPKDLLPDWLRFVKGVVDSEDLPLSISREKPQDSALLRRIGNTITRKVLRHLDDVSKKDKEAYNVFWAEYSRFIKEGVCQDPTFQAQAAKLLRFESSKLNQGEITSLDEYIARCSEEQQEIYYLMAPTRELAEQSPYYEAFKANNTEVLFLYNTLDDFTMDALKSYNGRRLVGADSNSVDLKASKKSKKSKKGEENKEGEDSNKEEEEEEEESGSSLTTAQATDLCTWIKSTLGDKLVKEVGVTERLASTPAMITDHENGSLRRMMKFLEQQNAGQAPFLPQQHLDINPSHPIIVGLFALKESNPAIAAVIARQVYDNAMVNAGMMDDGREMVPRINQLMEALIGK